MRSSVSLRSLAACVTVVACLVSPPRAHAQDSAGEQAATREVPRTSPGQETRPSPHEARPALVQPFVDAMHDIRHLPSWQNVTWLAAGLGAAAAIHPADESVSRELSEARTQSFRPGAVLGGTPLELGASFAAFAIGRATGKPRVMTLGSDLVRAQLLAELVTTGVKQSVRRPRPQGGGFSFPSGHTAVTFASATVIQKHFGWKAGVPAFAVASYVGASRVQMQRHYLSDVAFGAAVGIVAGRTVTIGSRHKFVLAPMASPAGGGLSLTWLGQP